MGKSKAHLQQTKGFTTRDLLVLSTPERIPDGWGFCQEAGCVGRLGQRFIVNRENQRMAAYVCGSHRLHWELFGIPVGTTLHVLGPALTEPGVKVEDHPTYQPGNGVCMEPGCDSALTERYLLNLPEQTVAAYLCEAHAGQWQSVGYVKG